MTTTFVVATVIKVIVVALVLISTVPILTWVERRGSGFIQLRRGPNRVGPFGLLQPLADGLKFFFKEDIVPGFVYRPFYVAAPAVAFTAAVLAFAVIPFFGTMSVAGETITGVILDLEVGLLFLLGASSMGVFGIILAGWASNNKYSQMGGLRSSAQMVSYELALGLAVAGVLVFAGTLNPIEIVELQAAGLWNIAYLPFGLIGFLVLLISSFAEANRLPFDLPEAESELVGGYHTEYSSMKFSMFFMAEYINMITGSALVVTLFLGGYAVPDFIKGPLGLEGNALAIAQVASFTLKMAFFLWLYVWVRWTLPRFRYDQLMRIGWKVLIPIAFANVVGFALFVMWGIGP
jgi:NADH-quinone oxidoreductase subunit H